MTWPDFEVYFRLSKEWDEKISADESNVENINIKNRPLKLAKEFALIAASEWLEAKGALDQYSDMSEYDKLTLLCDIMLVCSTFFVGMLSPVNTKKELQSWISHSAN